MPVRLNKALKELNVGINTVTEFLHKKGVALQDASPNAKITDEQYKMLMDAFGADKTKHEEIQKQMEKGRLERERQKMEKKQKQQEIYRLSSEPKQQFKVLGNINDLKSKAEEKKESTPVAAAEKPVVEKPQENVVVAETAAKSTDAVEKPTAGETATNVEVAAKTPIAEEKAEQPAAAEKAAGGAG